MAREKQEPHRCEGSKTGLELRIVAGCIDEDAAGSIIREIIDRRRGATSMQAIDAAARKIEKPVDHPDVPDRSGASSVSACS